MPMLCKICPVCGSNIKPYVAKCEVCGVTSTHPLISRFHQDLIILLLIGGLFGYFVGKGWMW